MRWTGGRDCRDAAATVSAIGGACNAGNETRAIPAVGSDGLYLSLMNTQPLPAPVAYIGHPLVAAKLAPRPGGARHLPRPRLRASLDDDAVRLVLVRAPAGFGKTTFLTEYHGWLQAQGVAVGWLTLDDGDNDVSRFLTHMLAAFQSVDPGLGLIRSDRLSGSASAVVDGSTAGAAIDLVHRLSVQREAFALFLDNVEAVRAPTVIGMIRTLLEALPVGGRMIIGSRETPRLGLGRLRAHGQLVEITQETLRFSDEESATLLREQFGLALDASSLALLQARTQGWAAATWLAALALRDHRDPTGFVRTFGGSHAAVADYLLDDVLSRLPAESRDFLLAISVLDELHPPLCDALTGRHDSAERLSALEQAGLFVIPQGPDGRSFRLHPLFQDFLRTELARADCDAAGRLKQWAAVWHLQRGQPVAALDHLIGAGEVAGAIALLREHAEPLLWRGRVLLLTRFFDRLPAAADAGAPPTLPCVHAWALLLTHRLQEAGRQFDLVEARDALPPEVVLNVATGRAFLLAMTDRIDDALLAWSTTDGLIDQAAPTSDARAFLASIRQNSYACCLLAANRFDEALRALAAGVPSHRRLASSFNLAVSICLEGSAELARGRVGAAVTACRAAVMAATTHPGQHAPGSIIAAAFLAEACYIGGEIGEAGRLLDACLPLIDEIGAPDQLITSHVVLAKIAWRQGRQAQAFDHLAKLERRGLHGGLARLAASGCLMRSHLWILAGDTAAAAREISRAALLDPRDPGGPLSLHANDTLGLELARLRLMIHTGQESAAEAPLRSAIARACEQGRLRRAGCLQILLAIALGACGRPMQARAVLHEAARDQEAGALTVVIEDEGPRAREMLAWLQAPDTEPGAAPREAAGVRADCAQPSAGRAAHEDGGLIEALTASEQRILMLLAEGHANRVIARRLFVTESTVKTHLRSISAKLGATNRTHAVAIARRRGLIAEPG